MESHTDDDQATLLEVRKTKLCSGRRTVIVEPLLVLYVAAGLPLMSIRSQFMYQKVAESMNINLDNLTGNNSNCDVNYTDPAYVTKQSVQSSTATLSMYISMTHFLPTLFATLAYGVIGDRIGRRTLLILPCIGSLTQITLYMFIIKFDLSEYFFFLEGIEYLFGGMPTLFLGAFAYIVDTVPTERLSFRMTVLETVSLANGAITSVVVGYWIKAQGFFWPLVFVAGGKVLAITYAFFFIPETVRRTENSRKVTFRSLFSGLKLILFDNGSGRRFKINILLVSYTLGCLVSAYSILTLYEMNSPLCWGPVFIGYFQCASMLMKCLAMLVAAGLLKRLIPIKWQLLLSKLSGCIEYFFIAIVSTTAMMFIAPVLGCISFLGIPLTRALLSTHVGKHEQASMFSLMAASSTITNLVSSVGTNKIYAASLMFMEGFVFLIDAFCHLIGAGLIGIYIYKTRNVFVLLERPEQFTENVQE